MCLGNLHQQNYKILNIKNASSSSVGGQVPKEAAKKEEGLSSSPHKKFSVAKYQFPSVQQRLQYYMGDWYNRSDWTVHDSDCKVLREVTDYLSVLGKDIMLRTTDIKECLDVHAKKTTTLASTVEMLMMQSTALSMSNIETRIIIG